MSTQVEELLANTAWLRRLARTLVADEHTAEDLVQEACCAELAREAAQPRELRAWLAGVVRKLAQRHHRARDARTRREERAARSERVPPAGHFLEEAELQKRLLAAVLALEEPYRSTIVARFLEGASAEQIARRERVPASTVRTRIQRALARLRQTLDRELDGREAWALVALRAPQAGPNQAAQTSPAPARSVVRSAVAAGALVALGVVTWRVLTPSVPVAESVSSAPSASESVAVAAGAHAPVAQPSEALVDALTPISGRSAQTTPDSGTSDRSALAVVWRLTGRIIDPEGAPVSDAGVLWRDKYGVWHRQNETHTDADGLYAFAFESQEIALDVRDLGVLHPRFQSRLASFVLTKDSFTDGAATVDVQLERGVRVLFQCTDEEGHPLPQVRLRLTANYDAIEGALPYRVEGWTLRDWSAVFHGARIATGWTDSAGLCTLDGVATGAQRLLVWSQGFLTKELVIAPESTELHTVVLEHGPLVRGIVVDSAGTPVAGAEVYLDAEARQQWSTTKTDGTFESGGLGFTRVRVSVVHPDFAPLYTGRKPIDLGPGDLSFTLDHGRTVDVVLVDDDTDATLAGTARLDLVDDHYDQAAREATPDLSVELVAGELHVEKLGRFLAGLWIRIEGYDPFRLALTDPATGTGEVARLVPSRNFEVELVEAGSDTPVLDGVVRVGQEMAAPPGRHAMTGTQMDASNTPTFIHANHFTIPSHWLRWNERVSVSAWAYGYAPLELQTTKTDLRAGTLRIALRHE